MSSMDLAWLRPRAVVMNSAHRILDHDGREIGPAGRVAQRPLGERDAVGRRAHGGVVPIEAQHLPRTTLRETRKSRQIALILIFREKCARRILAILSTNSISNWAP